MVKLNVVLVSSQSKNIGSAVLEVDGFFTLNGGVIWKNRYFEPSFAYGPQPDPFPLYEVTPAPLVLGDDEVNES